MRLPGWLAMRLIVSVKGQTTDSCRWRASSCSARLSWSPFPSASARREERPQSRSGRCRLPTVLRPLLLPLPASRRPEADYAFRRGSGESSADAHLAAENDCLTTNLGETYCGRRDRHAERPRGAYERVSIARMFPPYCSDPPVSYGGRAQ